MSLFILGVFLVLMFLGIPVAVSLGMASLGAILMYDTSTIASAVKLMYSSMNSFTMVAVPLFFLAGVILGQVLARRVPDDAGRELTEYLQGYLALEGARIIAGLGIIENDFHNRKDLSPNLCALYTEPDRRGRGIAGSLLSRAWADLQAGGICRAYLVTELTSFYERYGWAFHCMVQDTESGQALRLYTYPAA